VAALAATTYAAPAHAATRTVTGQTGYFCDIQQGNGKKPITSDTMTLSMSLTVPTSVSAGQRVLLRGTLSLAFPEELSQQAKGFVTTADGYSDTISLQFGAGGTTLRADRWQTPEIPVGDPIVVHAPIAFPAFTVPSGASSVDLRLPGNGVTGNPYFPTPAKVAFTASAAASGPLGTFHFNLACYLKGGSPATVARIPVGASGGTGRAGAAPGTASSGGAATTTGQQGSTDTTAGSSQPGATAPSAAGGAAAKRGTPRGSADVPGALPSYDGSVTTDGQLASAAPVAAADPDRHDGIYVSPGLLVGIGGLVCLAALGYAAWAHYRLRILQQYLDD